MAKYPIYESTGTMPGQGPNRTWHYNTDTGGAEVGRSLQQFGGALFDLNASIYRQQGETELAEKTADADMKIQKMYADFAGQDENTYDQTFRDTWSEIAGAEVKNGWARRQYRTLMTKTMPQQYELVQKAKAQRSQERWESQEANLAAQAVTTGNVGLYGTFVGSAVEKGRMTKEEADGKILKVAHDAELETQLQRGFADPASVLEDLKDDRLDSVSPLGGPSLLDSKDLLRVRNIASTRQKDDQIALVQQQKKLNTGLWTLSMQPGTTGEDVLKAIDALPVEVYDDAAKDKLYKSTMARITLIQKGLGDPLKVRQDYGVYKDLLFQAVDGTATESDFRKAVNDNKITTSDYEHLVNIVEGKPGARSEANILKDLLTTMGRLFDGAIMDEEMQEVAKVKGQQILEDRIKAADEAGKPLKDRDLQTEMLRVYQQVRDESFLAATADELLALPEPPKKRVPGESAILGSGQNIGVYDEKGKVVLNDDGVKALADYAISQGWTIAQARAYAEKKGYIIP